MKEDFIACQKFMMKCLSVLKTWKNHRPCILGGFWNGKDKTVETVANTVKKGKVRVRTIKTRTGHEIQFVEEDDKKSKAGIYIKTSKGHRIDINNSGNVSK